MKITYDKEAEAVYIQLADEIKPGGVKKTYPCNPIEVKGMVNLDFDEEGRLVGIEVLGANNKLPKELLEQAEIIG